MTFSDEEFSNSFEYLPVLTCLGGYCSNTVIEKTKCDQYKENLILEHEVNLDKNCSLIKNLDWGGLKCPDQFVVLYNYLVVNKLYTHDEEFINKIDQRDVAIGVTLNTLKSNEIYFEGCINGQK